MIVILLGVKIMIISERIFKIMEEKGIRQTDFSAQTGISQSTISDWKRKKTNPSSDKIMVICETLGVSPYELLQDNNRDNTSEMIDYKVVSEGTDSYDLLVEFEQMDKSMRDRLIGYMDALIQGEKRKLL